MIDLAVAIPTFNSEKYISTAIESVKSQSVPGVPIYVFDNNSTDRTVAICEKFTNVTVCQSKQNVGFSKNIRNCFYLTPHQYVALLCSDDWYERNHLEAAMIIFRDNNTVQYYFSFAKLIYEDPQSPDGYFQFSITNNLIPPLILLPRLLKSHIIPISSLVINKHILTKVPQDCWEGKLSDWEFTIHSTSNFTGWCEKQYNVCYLQRPSSMGQQWYLEEGYCLNRINLFFKMTGTYPVLKRTEIKLIIYRWMETFIIAMYKREKGFLFDAIKQEINSIADIIKSNMNNHYIVQLFMSMSKLVLIQIVRVQLLRKMTITIVKAAGIGKMILADSE